MAKLPCTIATGHWNLEPVLKTYKAALRDVDEPLKPVRGSEVQ